MQDVHNVKEQLNLFLEKIPTRNLYQCRFNHKQDLLPVDIGKVDDQSSIEIGEIIHRYEGRGFALFDLNSNNVNLKVNNAGFDALTSLGKFFNLGEPHIPVKYKNQDTINLYRGGINIISTHLNGRPINCVKDTGQQATHAFTTTKEQELHVDGTTEVIGLIKTSILLCINPAITGGENTIFNSVAAFVELAKQDIDAAVSLLDPRCLRRTNLAHGNSCTGPVFSIKDGNIITRYSTDITSSWEDGLNSVKHLERAYKYLREMAKPGSPFLLTVKLKSGQGLIIANDKVSHGRRLYRESQNDIRLILRSIFFNAPSN